jgi:hypothetical protein
MPLRLNLGRDLGQFGIDHLRIGNEEGSEIGDLDARAGAASMAVVQRRSAQSRFLDRALKVLKHLEQIARGFARPRQAAGHLRHRRSKDHI